MELGGKSPLIICDDADLDRAADIAMMANFYSSGQVCTNGTACSSGLDESRFEAKIAERVARIRVGNPEDENTNFGPLVSFAHMESVLGYIAKGKEEGARVLRRRASDRRRIRQGRLRGPDRVHRLHRRHDHRQEEIFGPVMSILSYETEEEVIRRANDTDFGLAAGVCTNDLTAPTAFINWKPASAGSTPGASRRPKCRLAATSSRASAVRTASARWLNTLASSRSRSSWAATTIF
jgi:betaine-aldehyde dehydrogenase